MTGICQYCGKPTPREGLDHINCYLKHLREQDENKEEIE
jgi:hypothetical protein